MKKIDSILIYSVLSIPLIFVAGFFLWGNFLGPNRQELFMEESHNLTFNGVVDSIYNDKQNHNSRTALLSGGYKYELYDYWAPYFEVGDSVSKAKGSFELFVHKKNRKIIKLDYRTLKGMFRK